MKKTFFIFVLIALIVVSACLLSSCGFPSSAESVSMEEFMEYHTVSEIVDYLNEHYDKSYVAEVFNSEWDGYYFISEETADETIDRAYGYGYYEGAVENGGKLKSAVSRGDIAEIRSELAWRYSWADFY